MCKRIGSLNVGCLHLIVLIFLAICVQPSFAGTQTQQSVSKMAATEPSEGLQPNGTGICGICLELSGIYFIPHVCVIFKFATQDITQAVTAWVND